MFLKKILHYVSCQKSIKRFKFLQNMTYLSGHDTFKIIKNAEEKLLKNTGPLESDFHDDILKICILSIGDTNRFIVND